MATRRASVQRVHVPSAAAFLVRKMRIHDKRDHADKAKDILRIHTEDIHKIYWNQSYVLPEILVILEVS